MSIERSGNGSLRQWMPSDGSRMSLARRSWLSSWKSNNSRRLRSMLRYKRVRKKRRLKSNCELRSPYNAWKTGRLSVRNFRGRLAFVSDRLAQSTPSTARLRISLFKPRSSLSSNARRLFSRENETSTPPTPKTKSTFTSRATRRSRTPMMNAGAVR
jgi:hypothetical protein